MPFRSKQTNKLLARTMTPNSIKHKAMQAEGKYHGQNTPGTDSGVSHHQNEEILKEDIEQGAVLLLQTLKNLAK